MEEFKNLKEIIELSEEEINNNDKNVSAILDLIDLKELRNLIARNKDLEKNYINPNKARISYFDKGKGTKVVIEGFIPKSKVKEKIDSKFKEAKGLYERGVQPQAQFTMKLLRDLEKELLED